MRLVLDSVNAITARILPQNANCNATIRLTFCTTLLMKSNNAQMFLSIWYNINAITVCILPQSAECNATIRLTFCATLLTICNNAQMHEIGIAQC